MSDLIKFPDDWDDKPGDYDYDRYMNEMGIALDVRRCTDAKVAIYVGLRLLIIKENVLHGKLLETYEELGLKPWVAQNCMQLARVYGDNPTYLEEIGVRKALDMKRHSDMESIIQFKENGLWRDPEGNLRTHAEIAEMTTKELSEITKKLKRELSIEKNLRREDQIEMDEMIEEYKKKQVYIKKLEHDSNPAMAEKLEAEKKVNSDLLKEIVELRESMVEKEREQVEGEEAFKKLVEAAGNFLAGIANLNTIKLTKDYDPELKARFYGLIAEIRTRLEDAESRAYVYFGQPIVELREEDIYRGENDEQEDT